MRRVGFLLAAALLFGCATLANSKTACPEYRDLRCATGPECSMDRERGCEVCQCSPSAGRESGMLPSGIPPDRRWP